MSDKDLMSEAEYMAMYEYPDMEEEEEDLTYAKINELITELAIVGRRMKGTNKVVLDILDTDTLKFIAWGAYAQGDYNEKYEHTVVDILHGNAHYLDRRKTRLTLMGFIRPFVDRRVDELFK
ncbi:hypothetical protein TSARBOMBA_187 [Bacillus phage TsarBomba]|uniref:Uncharacterized protein n=1 Tax=Bacillus phage TsarBomba TaxID=1690456 RepID=A0A0K2D0D8_9CAUD|nr:hypothetical protein TSARBOMBA_187 [Bacillus phage TsarBomba]ALA13220.1 hypothetical protein TSARBOMBA_187 [Bacillus phage TsarBomba]